MSYRHEEAIISPFAGLSVGLWLQQLADLHGDKTMLVFEPEEGPRRSWSYRGFVGEVAQIAGGLLGRGIRPGDRLLVHLENCPETLLARFACAWIGAVCVGTNPMAAGPEIAHFARATGARAAITQPKFADLVAVHCPDLSWIAVTHDDAGIAAPHTRKPERAHAFALLKADPPPPARLAPETPVSIMFTTGTTSLPKAVVWTHANMLWAARLNALQQQLRTDDVALFFLPLFHVVGLAWCTLSMLWVGGTVVLQPRFSRSRFWPAAIAHRATVSSHVFATIKLLGGTQMPAHSFRRFIYARHEPEIERQFGVDLVSGWGMTEILTQAIVCEPGSRPPAGVIGRPSVGYAVRIVGEDGREVAPGEQGELLIGGRRGLSIFLEYDGNAVATADAFDAQGFFRTGDRVLLREDGWIAFADRIKDVLKVGGEGVSASEIEAVLASDPVVRDVAVVGCPHDIYGETPCAFVVLTADAPAADGVRESLIARCGADLARFKVPTHIVFLEDLPRVGFGKINKVRLRELAKNLPQAKKI